MAGIRLSFVFCLLTTSAVAQDILWGVKGGLNLSDIVLNDVVNPDVEADYKMKTGWHSGIFAVLELDNTWSFSSEFQYSLKGVSAAGTKINLHYIDIPLLLKYSYSENFTLEVGPDVGYLFLANSPYGNVSNVYNNNLDIGVNAGCEFKLSEKLFLGARFSAGFSSVIKQGAQAGGPSIKYQNRVLQFSVGYFL